MGMSNVTIVSGRMTGGAYGPRRHATAVGSWLLCVAFLVFLMVAIGGITRLTESGLSIVDWRPVTGILPPLDAQDWQEAFAAYRESPEYRINNRGMSLEDFKGIYWWEYIHRLLGRLIGLAFALPLLWFWFSDRIPNGTKPRLVGLLLLGGLQGLMGWLMVSSGLVDEPEVSHIRLTAHLGLAMLIFGALFATALDLLLERRHVHGPRLRRIGKLLLALLAIQILLGGLVAGLKAGHIHNSWPSMDGHVFPPGLLALEPMLANLTDNATFVQFAHRLGAYALFVLALFLLLVVMRGRHSRTSRLAALLVFGAILMQAVLGIATLLDHVPISLGVAHQSMAAFVLASVLLFLHLHRGRRA
ncbi:MAG: COX15/CtaA family protein [Rhodothalassiaceae bacterium]